MPIIKEIDAMSMRRSKKGKLLIHGLFYEEFSKFYHEDLSSELQRLASHLADYPEDGDQVVEDFDLPRILPWTGRNGKRSHVLYAVDPRGKGAIALIGCKPDSDIDHDQWPDQRKWFERADRVVGFLGKIVGLIHDLFGSFRDGTATRELSAEMVWFPAYGIRSWSVEQEETRES